MKQFFKSYLRNFFEAIESIINFYADDMELISKEGRSILSHPEDRIKYEEAIGKIKNGAREASFTRHNGEEITLIR